MKKIIAIILTSILCLSLIACGEKDDSGDTAYQNVEFHGITCYVPKTWEYNSDLSNENSAHYIEYGDENVKHSLLLMYQPDLGDLTDDGTMSDFISGFEESEEISNVISEESEKNGKRVQELHFDVINSDGLTGKGIGVVFNVNVTDLIGITAITADGNSIDDAQEILDSIIYPAEIEVETTQEATTAPFETAETEKATTNSISNPSLKIDDSTEANSSDRVDAIIRLARDDAENLNADGAFVAAKYIAQQYPDLFANNEVMENVMYYGALLEYWALDTQGFNEFGQDAVQAVKYVYRGVESKDDAATQENLRQMGKDAQNIVNQIQ